MQIPINFVTQPAVSLSAACFGKKVYDEEAAKQCISNLLSVGYRRLLVDVYWSPERKKWSLCPVNIPIDAAQAARLPASLSTRMYTPTMSGNPPQGASFPAAETRAPILGRREVPITKGSSGVTLYQLGPYSCSASVDLAKLIRVVADYFRSTEDTLNAHLTYLIFNLHAAASVDAPEDPARAVRGDQLPSQHELLGTTVQDTFGTYYIYTPSELESERSDLNKSWYSLIPSMRPITEYFEIKDKSNGRQETPDGWPGEGYVEISKAQRLLLGWGNIDPQMRAYNFTGDRDTIFSADSISSFVTVTKDNDGDIKVQCLYNPNSTDVANANSWASDEIPHANSSVELSFYANQMVSCGVSPLVNHTLLNVTADEDITPYRNVSLSSIWSWADGEPQNATNGAIVDQYRCSVMDLSLSGHWRATGCSDRLYAACRVGNSPYRWTLSNEPETYVFAGASCPENSSFAVPRTALENTYLYEYLLDQPKHLINASSLEVNKRNVWIDFNSVDVPTCWVTGGPMAQCPYEVDERAIERRNIIIPSIAAIIILVITALTIFVKCNANRRNSRRRRVIDGWEYEGVPS